MDVETESHRVKTVLVESKCLVALMLEGELNARNLLNAGNLPECWLATASLKSLKWVSPENSI